MINRVLLVGELCAAPESDFENESCSFPLRARHTTWSGEVTETTLLIKVRGERRAKVMTTWMRQGSKLVVHGHLRQGPEGLEVELEKWQFLSDKVELRSCFLEPQAA